jgi:hypothetical protein
VSVSLSLGFLCDRVRVLKIHFQIKTVMHATCKELHSSLIIGFTFHANLIKILNWLTGKQASLTWGLILFFNHAKKPLGGGKNEVFTSYVDACRKSNPGGL